MHSKSNRIPIIDNTEIKRSALPQTIATKIQSMHLSNSITVKIQHPQNISFKGCFQAHANTISGLEIDPLNPQYLYSSSFDNTVKFWDIKPHTYIKNISLVSGSGTLTLSSGSSTPKYDMKPFKTITNSKRQRVGCLLYHTNQNILVAG